MPFDGFPSVFPRFGPMGGLAIALMKTVIRPASSAMCAPNINHRGQHKIGFASVSPNLPNLDELESPLPCLVGDNRWARLGQSVDKERCTLSKCSSLPNSSDKNGDTVRTSAKADMELEPQRSSQASGHQSGALKERAEQHQHQYVLCLLVMLASAAPSWANGERA
jgi:hypothetical protein